MGMFEEFPPKIALLLAVASVAYIACMASPLLVGLWAAKRLRPAMARPWVFAIILLVGSYGLLTAIGFLALIPTQAYLVFVAPQLDAANLVEGGFLTSAASFLARFWWLMYGPALLVSSLSL